MSLVTGLLQGLKDGLLVGLDAWWGSVNTLASLDFTTPVTQEFPTTAAGLASLLGDAAATPSYIWDCQESSGNFVDSIASEPLVLAGISPLQGQTAVGLGLTRIGDNAFETASTDAKAIHTSPSFFDQTTSSFACLGFYRTIGNAAALVCGKRNATNGFSVYGGPAQTQASVVGSTGSANATLSTPTAEGAWHTACIVVNRTTDVLHVITETGTVSTSITGVGSLTNTGQFGMGFMSGWASTAVGVQHRYLAAFEGAAAEAIDLAAIQAFHTHATDPTGLLTTQTRGSAISVPVAEGYVGHFAEDTIAIGYDAGFSHASKLGLATNRATENIIDYSEDLTSGWANQNSTEVGNDADAPDGFRSATEVTSTTTLGRLYRSNPVVVAETTYTLSVWARADTDHTATIEATIAGGSTTPLATSNISLTSAWQRFSVTFTTQVGQVGTRIHLYPGESGVATGVAHFWGAQLELGTGAGHYIRTSGSAESLVASVYTAPFVTTTAVGEITNSVMRINYVAGTSQYPYDVLPTSGNHNRKRNYYDTITRWRHFIYDGAGTLEDSSIFANSASIGTEDNFRFIWDQSTDGALTGGKETRAVRNGSLLANGSVSPWDGATGTGDVAEIVSIGHSGNLNQLNGFVATIVSYDTLKEPLP